MNKKNFLNLLKDPDNISANDLKGLEDVLVNFPFFQAAHVLTAKGAKDHGQMLSEEKIRKAAAYISERKILKSILIPKDISAHTDIHHVLKEETIGPSPSSLPSLLSKEDSTFIVETEDLPNNQNIQKIADLSLLPTSDSSSPDAFKKSETLFSELEENLKQLQSLKEKIATSAIETKAAPNEVIAVTINESANDKEDNPFNQAGLIPEPLKEHQPDIQLLSTRLDEVIMTEDKSDIQVIPEAELLLNYFSFLKNNQSLEKKKKTEHIIENFIKKDPSIPKMDIRRAQDEQEDKASQSYKLKSGLISENMANIYIRQGKKDKAIEIYKQLILKNPEKSTYFMSQIEKIKETF